MKYKGVEKEMELFKVRFINKIRPDTIEIRYRAVLESHASETIFEGSQLFHRDFLKPQLLKTGEVALRAIGNIFSAIPDNLVLDQLSFEQSHDRSVLEVPSKSSFDQFIINHNQLDRVQTHQNKDGKAIIDTKMITELRIG
ncbi:hypothetical protein HMPREF0497_2395 [Lentilactobacillus buchneri ATCC 11577]|uniref:hypothetical protein n=1 Tax=Lentilactobacillus hilgardii TaxID=1588 RepID=UPI00019C6558|nr:hypothetical protein [Lentilactobacillus hilgardii]EEI18786.1 hypothetical protein HMPREF0497_2395 [Lentilactobacillus buchneri ATCC 11577]